MKIILKAISLLLTASGYAQSLQLNYEADNGNMLLFWATESVIFIRENRGAKRIEAAFDGERFKDLASKSKEVVLSKISATNEISKSTDGTYKITFMIETGSWNYGYSSNEDLDEFSDLVAEFCRNLEMERALEFVEKHIAEQVGPYNSGERPPLSPRPQH